MSTSLLVTKMQEYAHSIGDEAKIWAVGQDQAKKEMAEANVVLIGPQMSLFKRRACRRKLNSTVLRLM